MFKCALKCALVRAVPKIHSGSCDADRTSQRREGEMTGSASVADCSLQRFDAHAQVPQLAFDSSEVAGLDLGISVRSGSGLIPEYRAEVIGRPPERC